MAAYDAYRKVRMLILALTRRNVGNTTLMVDGTKNYNRPFNLIVDKADQGYDILNRSNGNSNLKIATIEDGLQQVLNSSRPIAIDHSTLAKVLTELTDDYSATLQKLSLSTDQLNQLFKVCILYQQRAIKFDELLMERFECKWWEFMRKSMIMIELAEIVGGSDNERQIETEFTKLKQILDDEKLLEPGQSR